MNLPRRYVAWLTINRNCNLRCKWCYATETDFRGFMSMKIFNRAVELMINAPVKNVILIGGEPTLHPNFLDMTRILASKGYIVYVVSNGLRFADEDFLKKAIGVGVRAVTTSIKAADSVSYREATGVDAFDITIKAIRNLETARSETFFHKVSLILCGRMFSNFDRTIDVLVALGVKTVAFDTEKPTILNGKVYYDGGISPREMARFICRCYEKVKTSGMKFNFKITVPFCLFPEGFLEMLQNRNEMTSGCQILNGSGYVVDVNGGLLPCNHFCSHPLGNLDECQDSFVKWRTREDIIAFYDKLGRFPAKQCQECSRWKYCGGGCRMYWLNMGAEMLQKGER